MQRLRNFANAPTKKVSFGAHHIRTALVSLTMIMSYKDQDYDGRSKIRALETVKFLDWLISKDAQDVTKKVHYSPLPEKTVEKAKQILRTVNYGGEGLL